MNYSRLLILCLFITNFITFCKNKEYDSKNLTQAESRKMITANAKMQSSAKMHIPVLQKNFGEVTRGDTLEHIFNVYNTGQDTLNILEMRPSCPCITASLNHHKIAPHDSAQIHVFYHTATKMGYDEKELWVKGDGFPEQLTIRLTAEIRANSHK